MICAEMAEPIDLPFGFWTWVGQRKNKYNRIHQYDSPDGTSVPSWEGTSRHLANTIEPSVCGSDAALCQITLTTCHLLMLLCCRAYVSVGDWYPSCSACCPAIAFLLSIHGTDQTRLWDACYHTVIVVCLSSAHCRPDLPVVVYICHQFLFLLLIMHISAVSDCWQSHVLVQ